MKVTYRKTIVQRITDEKALAENTGREIEYITLTAKEWDKALKELHVPPWSRIIDARGAFTSILGVEVRVEA